MPAGPPPGVPPPFKRKHAGGRPSALTPELTERIVQHLREFAFFETACNLEGVPSPTGRSWLLRGRRARKDGRAYLKSEKPFAEFSSAVEATLAETEVQITKGVLHHGKRDWRALAWLARCKFPQHFGDRPAAKVADTEEPDEEGTAAAASEVDARAPGSGVLTDDDYAEAAALLLRRKRTRLAALRLSGLESGQ